MTATRKRTIPRAPESDTDLGAIVGEYLQNRSMRERSEHFEGRLKRDLLALIDTTGEEVEPHKKVLELDEPIPYRAYKSGKGTNKSIIGIERRERVSSRMDEDKVLALLEKKKLIEECTTIVRVVDEDAVLAANYAGKITDKEYAALLTTTVTPAFYLTEGTS